MLTENPGAVWMSCPALVPFPRQKSTSGGSSDSDVNEFAVMARIEPSTSRAMTVTPVTNCPTVWRNVRSSTSMVRAGSILRRSQLLHDHADVVSAHHVGRRPAVQIVFRHALFGEPLVALRGARDVGHHERLEPDALVVPEVVALVQLVTPAELAADGIPEQLHQLHALLGAVSVRPADE